MKLVDILLESTIKPVTVRWGDLTVQKLRDLGFDALRSGVKLPTEYGDQQLVWGAAIGGSRQAMRAAEARMERYKNGIENQYDVQVDTEVSFDENGVATVPGVEAMSAKDMKDRNDAYSDLKAKALADDPTWSKD